MSKYKNILKDEISSYHKQLHKMKNNNISIIAKLKRKEKL